MLSWNIKKKFEKYRKILYLARYHHNIFSNNFSTFFSLRINIPEIHSTFFPAICINNNFIFTESIHYIYTKSFRITNMITFNIRFTDIDYISFFLLKFVFLTSILKNAILIIYLKFIDFYLLLFSIYFLYVNSWIYTFRIYTC